MSKRNRRVPRYQREEDARREAEAQARGGLPPDAIPADPSQQTPNNSYGPPLYYQNVEFTCVDCGVAEVWTAEQQNWWYEVAKGSIYSGPKSCRPCRDAHREAHQGTPRRSHAERTGDANP